MALTDWIPPYWRDTRDFQQLKLALDDGVQPLMNFVEYFFGMCSNASSWPEEVLTEILLKCGYPEAATASRERKQELIRRALRTRGLITEQVFANYLKDAFDVPHEDPWPYGLVINHANMHVEVVAACEDCSDGMRPKNGAESFRYDNMMTNLQYSFPAGVSLVLQCNMPETEIQRYYGAVTSVVVDIRGELTVGWSSIDMYDARFTWYDGEYNPFEGYRVEGATYSTEQSLNSAGYYITWTSPTFLGETQKIAIQRYDGYVQIEGWAVFDVWYNWHNQWGYTDHPTNEITVYEKNNAWAPTNAFYDPENGEYFVTHVWYADEATMNSAGYYIEIPLEGLEYGVMGASSDTDKAVWQMGNVGHIEREMGDMVDAGFVSYGVMKEPSRTTVTVGVTATVPATTFAAESPYYWFYNFQSGSNYNNLWDPTKWSNNVNPSNPPGSNYTIPDSNYEEVWLWDGQSVLALANTSYTFRLGIYNLRPEFYTNIGTSVNNTLCACVIQPAAGNTVFTRSEYSLPDDLFTVSGTTLTWNTTHHLYNILNGKTVTILYYA